MTRTITHLYDTYDEATRAVRILEDAGIPEADISIVGRDSGYAGTDAGVDPAAGRSTLDTPIETAADSSTSTGAGAGASVGTVIGGGLGLLAGIGALAIPGVGPVVAAGWLIATITGAGIGAGAGGLLGSLTGAGHSEEDAHVYAEGVRRGGTLVSVRVDDAQAPQVETLLNGTGRVDVAQRGTEYRAGGWNQFDENRPVDAGAAGETFTTGVRGNVPAAPLGTAGIAPTAPPGTSPAATAADQERADRERAERERIERDRLGSSTHA